MPSYLVYNGSLYKNDALLVAADNRGLRYGDGLFETIKVKNGKIYFSNWHVERLFHGMQLLGFEPGVHFTAEYLVNQVHELCKKNKYPNARIRINIFRGSGGPYDPDSLAPNWIIECWPLEQAEYSLNQNGLVTGIYPNAKKSMDDFSNLKTNNYLPYLMAALHARRQKWNDALLLNNEGRICDASIANVFLVKKNIVFTPPLSEGCIAGIMRRHLAENLATHGFEFREQSINVEELIAADEVFFTNVMRGIRWVQSCGGSSYDSRLGKVIHDKLLKNLA